MHLGERSDPLPWKRRVPCHVVATAEVDYRCSFTERVRTVTVPSLEYAAGCSSALILCGLMVGVFEGGGLEYI